MRSGRARVGVLVGAAVCLAWFLLGAAWSANRAWRLEQIDPWHVEAPSVWPRTSRHVGRLDALLRGASPRVPPGSSVLVHAPSGLAPGQGFYLARWAAYLWPDREVRWALGSPAEGPVDAWVVHGGGSDVPGRRVVAASGELRVTVPADGS